MNNLEKEVYVVMGISSTNDWTIFSVHLEESDAKKKVDELKLGFEENKKLLETLKNSYKSNGYMMKHYLDDAIKALSRLIECNNYWDEVTYYRAPFIESTKNSDDKKVHISMQNICMTDTETKMNILKNICKSKNEHIEELNFLFEDGCLSCDKKDVSSFGILYFRIMQNGIHFDATVNGYPIMCKGTLYDCLKACNDLYNAKKYNRTV